MSKDKGGKNVKKAPGTGSKKEQSDYQANKKNTSKDVVPANKKK